jgi:DNA-directed RNA polymerase specialized sigma24 family protein
VVQAGGQGLSQVMDTTPKTLDAAPVAAGSPPGPEDFEAFVREAEPRLRRALVAAFGPEQGRDAAAEALAYAWEHWDRLSGLANLPGYLFRVGQTRGRRHKRQPVLHEAPSAGEYRFEPGLPAALAALTQRQRLAVVLVHGYGYTLREVAELTGLRRTSVQNHAERGLARLRAALGTGSDDHDE